MPSLSPSLIYGFDPLCGWCYGFAPALEALRHARPDLPIQLVLGGLVTGERVGPYKLMLPSAYDPQALIATVAEAERQMAAA